MHFLSWKELVYDTAHPSLQTGSDQMPYSFQVAIAATKSTTYIPVCRLDHELCERHQAAWGFHSCFPRLTWWKWYQWLWFDCFSLILMRVCFLMEARDSNSCLQTFLFDYFLWSLSHFNAERYPCRTATTRLRAQMAEKQGESLRCHLRIEVL